MPTPLAFLACIGALIIGIACLPEVTPTMIPDQDLSAFDPDTGSQTDASNLDERPLHEQLGHGVGTGSMTGKWLVVHEQSNCITLANTVQEALSVTFQIVDIVQEGSRLRESRDICRIHLFPIFSLDNIFPDAVAASINPILVEDSYITAAEQGGFYSSGIEFQPYGVNLEDPLADPLPTRSDDPSVVDSDGDGKPGVTLIVGGDCEMYTAQRAAIQYRGALVTPVHVRGESTTLMSQRVLGSSTFTCGARRDIATNNAFGRFNMYRVDGEGGSLRLDLNNDGRVDCADALLAHELGAWRAREPNPANCGVRQ